MFANGFTDALCSHFKSHDFKPADPIVCLYNVVDIFEIGVVPEIVEFCEYVVKPETVISNPQPVCKNDWLKVGQYGKQPQFPFLSSPFGQLI